MSAGTLTATMGIYPGSSNARPGGIVQFMFDVYGNIKIYMNTYGMAASCPTTDTTTQNVCGVHIHVGTVCNDNTLIGDHFWKSATATATDPWNNVKYSSDSVGNTNSYLYLPGGNGYDYYGNKGHAVVIHGAADATGTVPRIACGILN